MSDLTALPHRLDIQTRTCRAIVETPKGGRGKFTYDPESGLFELKRMLPDGMSFPLDFGFIPATRGEDGDPLDILVLGDAPTPIGVLLEVRLIGVIEARQTEGEQTFRNDRLIGVARVSHLFEPVAAIGDLGEGFLHNLTQFWVNYGRLRGATFEVIAIRGADTAVALIQDATNSP
jgi:inorganic pyrophosphatase